MDSPKTFGFYLDRRSVELFRILLGLVLLVDLCSDFYYARDFYSRDGLFPRTLWASTYEYFAVWSVHSVLDSVAFARCLIGIQIIAALALVAGYRSQLAAFISWILFVSLLNRNLLATDGGDQIASYLLFSAIFLPLSQRFSLDFRLGRVHLTHQNLITNLGAVFLVCQMAILYVFAGIAKLQNLDWWNGSAMDLILRWNEYAKPLAATLRSSSAMSKLAVWITPWFEVLGPIAFILGGRVQWLRTLSVVAFFVLHVFIHLSLTLSLFCFYPMAGLAALLPVSFWERLIGIIPSKRWKEFLTFKSSVAKNAGRPVDRRLIFIAKGVGIFLAACSAYSALPAVFGERKLPYSGVIQDVNDLTFGWQNWNLFRSPPHLSGWYRACGVTKDGRRIDIFDSGAAYNASKPYYPAGKFQSRRWQSYIMRAHTMWDTTNLRDRIALILSQNWNASVAPQERIEFLTISYHSEIHTPFGGDALQTPYVYAQWSANQANGADSQIQICQ